MNREIFVQRGKSPEIMKLLLEDGDRLITGQEFSLLTGLKRRTVQQRRYLGKGPGYFKLKESGGVRYVFSEVCASLSESSTPE